MSGLYDPTQTRLRLAYEPPATLCLLGYLPYRNQTRLKTRDHFELADFNSGLPLIYDPVHLGSLHPQLQGLPVWLQKDKVRKDIKGCVDCLGKVKVLGCHKLLELHS